MVALTYALCAITALACAIMLFVGARRTGSRMLFWSGLCFAGLSISNALIAVDAVTVPDLGLLRLGVSLVSVALLLYGLVFEEK
ncbi:DUF5985 family protein [Lysobacter sp. Root494]|jgi:hypothetical protein|uniref:DUF5985 family protein n=1 Tax=Lysobacter sp. Root494 TaxID=1736549 RepID=UPI0006F3951A|nr:DUF5985 family protein [Lysobacter sp. Root494]KQY54874.1 hypothetical protein ASD14_01500 [Lysobacter sp. Root494]